MNSPAPDSTASLRRAVYGLLIVVALGSAIGRIFAVQSPQGDTPFLSANDRSRWCTIAALVDHGTYVIDDVIIRDPDADDRRKKFDGRWQTIDKVRHRGADGREHYFSSKPPLYPTLLAGQYWLIKQLTEAGLEDRSLYVGRLMLILTNVVPLAIFLIVLARLVEQFGQTNWGRIFVVAAAAFGTFLTTFAVTLNNHSPAALTTLLAVWAALPIWRDNELRWRYFAAAGLFAGLTAANELPALLLVALLGAALWVKSPRQTLLGFAPAFALVAAAFFVTNYIAHQSLRPPYMHRSDGAVLAVFDSPIDELTARGLSTNEQPAEIPVSQSARNQITSQAGIDVSAQAIITTVQPGSRWVLWDPDGHDRLAINNRDGKLEVRAWDNWYDYDGSYWTGQRSGVDRGEASRAVYAFHVLVGHRGIFSLTPIWLLSAAGIVLMLRHPAAKLRGLALLTIALTVVVVGFYIARPMIDRNYGGVCCCLRWLIWLTPVWLLVLIPAADWMANTRTRRGLALLLLLVSIISSHYALLNPWSQPWLFDYLSYLQWISY